MTENKSVRSLPIGPLVGIGVVILLGCGLLILGAYFVFFSSPASSEPASTVTPTLTNIVLPTATLLPTTEVPPPTATVEEPTGEPTAIPPTDAPAPTAPPPTAPPPPPATAPPTEPPTPEPSPTSSHGVTNAAFSVENPVVGVNQAIWFNFSVTNAGTEALPFGYLGAVVFDSNGNNVNFQASWTGSELTPGQTLNWRDHTAIGTPGSYKLQLSICYSSVEQCASGGEWELLAQPVDVTVN